MSCHIWTMEILYWSISPKSTIKSVQSIQNYAAKVVCKKQNMTAQTEYHNKLHWLPIHYRCIYKSYNHYV